MFPLETVFISTRTRGIWILLTVISLMAGHLQAGDLRQKAAVEFQYRWRQLLIRFRPVDYVSPPGTGRVDLLLGRGFGDFNAYLYGKIDTRSQSWLGVRLDYRLGGLPERLTARIQFRAFMGLNEKSRKHYYLISYVNYDALGNGLIRPGILGYGKDQENDNARFYLGPAATLRISSRISTRLSYGANILGAGSLLYVKFYLAL